MAVFLRVLLVLAKECCWFVFGKLKQVVGIGDCEDSGATGVSTTSSSYGASLTVSCPGVIVFLSKNRKSRLFHLVYHVRGPTDEVQYVSHRR
jgi:hypothetical protein